MQAARPLAGAAAVAATLAANKSKTMLLKMTNNLGGKKETNKCFNEKPISHFDNYVYTVDNYFLYLFIGGHLSCLSHLKFSWLPATSVTDLYLAHMAFT